VQLECRTLTAKLLRHSILAESYRSVFNPHCKVLHRFPYFSSTDLCMGTPMVTWRAPPPGATIAVNTGPNLTS
jgi:hypothetical protein